MFSQFCRTYAHQTLAPRASYRILFPNRHSFHRSVPCRVFDHAQSFLDKFGQGQGTKDHTVVNQANSILKALKDETEGISVSLPDLKPILGEVPSADAIKFPGLHPLEPRDEAFVTFQRVTGK